MKNMNKALQFFLIFAIAFAAGIVLWTVLDDSEPVNTTPVTELQEGPVNLGYDNNYFIGTWKQPNDGKYHTLYVYTDSTLMIDTGLDTFYSYNYKIVDGELILFDGNSDLHMHRILAFNNDSVVFESLLDLKKRVAYGRD